MKKTYLTCAGIGSALLLTGMFVGIFLVPVFFSPVFTIDPLTNNSLDSHNRLILTGTTTLPAKSFITIKVDPSSPGQEQKTAAGYPAARGYVQVIPNVKKNLWKGVVDISALPPAEYTITFVMDETGENFTRIESVPLFTRQFTLGDENSGQGSIPKRIITEPPFIRINNPEENPPAADWRITGTTSLEPGTTLTWRLDEVTSLTAIPAARVEGTMPVGRGTGGIGRWSFTPGIVQSGGPFRITVSGKTGPSSTDPDANEIADAAEFAMTPRNQANLSDTKQHSLGFITIDSLPDIRQNGVYTITGTTSLPPGDELLFMVLPYSTGTEIDLLIDPVTKAQISRNPYSGQTGMVKVVQGDGTTNLWAFQLETYMMETGTFEVSMNNDRYDLKTGSLVYRGLNATRVFMLQEQLS